MLRERRAARRVSTSRTRILAAGPSTGGLAMVATTVEAAVANVATRVATAGAAGMAAGSMPAARTTTPIYQKTDRRDRKPRQAPIGSAPDSVMSAGPTTRGARTRIRVGAAIMTTNKASREDNAAASLVAGIPRADRAIISSAVTVVSAREAAGSAASRAVRDPAAAAAREARAPRVAAASRG